MQLIQAGSGGMSDTMGIINETANAFGSILVCFIGLIMAVLFIIFLIDVTQTKDTVRRNYPVIGRFRGLFTKLGEFFRQYFFAMDREEMPFNRAQRDYINDVCDDGHETVPFGLSLIHI